MCFVDFHHFARFADYWLETGSDIPADLHWTWCFDTPDYSLFRVDVSRGSGVLEMVLGRDFAGIICADYWGAYRKYSRLFDVVCASVLKSGR